METYWLLNWLDSRHVNSVHDLAPLFSKDSTIYELRDLAGQWSESVGGPPDGINLVAGTGLRLDDDLSCPSPSCRRSYVDVLFRHAWHYFDYILLPDAFGDLLNEKPGGWTKAYWRKRLIGSAELVLYLKEIGGLPLISYYPKDRVVVQNHPEQGENGDRWHAAWADMVPEFISNGEYKLHSLGRGSYELEATDPFAEATLKLRIKAKKSQAFEILRRQFINRRIERHMMELEQDISAAQQLKGTLGSALATHEKVLGRLSGTESANVLFNLSLPSLGHLPIKELIALRTQEGDAFAAFRQALSKAAIEIISISSDARPQQLAVQLVRDFIDPEISKIDSRLRSARRALSRKVAVSLPIAAVSAVCGLHLGINPVAAGTAGLLLTGAQNATAKYFEEKQAIEMSDMFFLWKALRHAE